MREILERSPAAQRSKENNEQSFIEIENFILTSVEVQRKRDCLFDMAFCCLSDVEK
jgi:hypothetical protein